LRKFLHSAIGNTNRLASLYADHKFSNLAALFPANADPGPALNNPIPTPQNQVA